MILEFLFLNLTGISTILVICCFLLVTWVKYVRSQYHVFTQLGIPGPQPSFLFGNALDFANKFPLDLFTEWSKTHGAVFGYYEGLQPSVVVTCPDLAHEILVKKFQHFSSRPQHAPFLWEREDQSLQNLNGLLWKRQRQAVAGGMSGRSIREMYPHVESITEELLGEIERAMSHSPQGFRVDDLMERYAVKVITQATLGYHSNAFSDHDDVTLRYMHVAHESASTENFASGLARLFPSLTSALKPLDRKHKFWAEKLNQSAQEFVNLVKRDPQSACPVMRSLMAHNLPASFLNSTDSKKHSLVKSNSHSKGAENFQVQRKFGLDSSPEGKVTNSQRLSQNEKHKFSHAEEQFKSSVYGGGKQRFNSTADGKGQFTQNLHQNREQSAFFTDVQDVEKELPESKTERKISHTQKQCQNGRENSSTSRTKHEDNVHDCDDRSLRHSEEDIVDQVTGLLNAGLGPLAVAITFVLYCLATQGHEQEKIMEEIVHTAASEDSVTLEELKKMKALERFILESMRMFPVAPGVTRECVKDCVLSDRMFTQGMVVRIMSGVMYRQEDHFGHAHQFRPDRFLDDYTKHAWLPFGHGPRKCVAERFAMLVFKLCTVRILHKFIVCATKDTQVPLQLALRPFLVPRDGVHVKFVARRSRSRSSAD